MNLSRDSWNSSSIEISCPQSCVFVSSSPAANYLICSTSVYQSSGYLYLTVFTSLFDAKASLSCATIVSGVLVPTLISIFFGTTQAFLKHLLGVSKTGFIVALHIYQVLVALCLSPVQSVSFRWYSLLSRSLYPGDSVSSVTVNCFITQIGAYPSTLSLDSLCATVLDILDRSLSLSRIENRAECMGPIFLSMRNIPLKLWSMYMVPSRMSTA